MACCALVAFIIGQLLVVWTTVRAGFRRRPGQAGGNVASQWMLGDGAPSRPARPRMGLRAGALLGSLAVLGLVGAARAHGERHDSGAGGLTVVAPLCGGATAVAGALASGG